MGVRSSSDGVGTAPTLRRVLVTGMGGELGSIVAAGLEREPWVGEMRGIDVDPPRRRLRTEDFHLVDPLDRARIGRLVEEFDPHLLVHFGVYEPDARASPRQAAQWTPMFTEAVLDGARRCRSLDGIIVRSGIELYGRGGHRPACPDEQAPIAPTTPFGRQLADVEARTRLLGHERRLPVALLRLAPVLGPHVPSPLGRLLRLPVVPIDLLGIVGRSRFSVIDDRDVATAAACAGRELLDGALNIVADGDVGVHHALREGRRFPWPVFGPQWLVARMGTKALGAPVPVHVNELLAKGRVADGSAAADLLGFSSTWTTEQVVASLYAWPQVIKVRSVAGRLRRRGRFLMAFVTTDDGVRLHYEVFGRPGGDPVLMIQGLGADKNGWDLQRLALAPHYTTIALDNRGAGRSDKPTGPFSLEQMADDAIAVLDAVGVERAHVMGASMGGAIAQVLAVRHRDRVRSLTLACTACSNHPWRRQAAAELGRHRPQRGDGRARRGRRPGG